MAAFAAAGIAGIAISKSSYNKYCGHATVASDGIFHVCCFSCTIGEHRSDIEIQGLTTSVRKSVIRLSC
jgi:hypothetical protein